MAVPFIVFLVKTTTCMTLILWQHVKQSITTRDDFVLQGTLRHLKYILVVVTKTLAQLTQSRQKPRKQLNIVELSRQLPLKELLSSKGQSYRN